MALVDTHCHLQHEKFSEDRDAVLARSLEVLDWLVVIGNDLDDSEALLPLLSDRVYGAVGIHPYHAKNYDQATEDQLRDWLFLPGIVALGETGLDYFNEFSPRADQARSFEAQLALAVACKKPVVIHNREADADCLAILRNFAQDLPGCIMHCFGSGPEVAEECVDLGFYVSFAGNVTFPKAQLLRDAAAVVPDDRILVETDAPYLAPPPLRGKRCEPHFVQHTAACLAAERGMSVEDFGALTTQNASHVYGLDA